MSELLQPGLHPDAEVLNAFAEGALPAHERTHTLAHLAACAHCREIVFLAQQAAPQPVGAPLSFWQRYRHSITLFGTAFGLPALACLLILFVTLRRHPAAAPTESARVQPPASPAPAPATPPLPAAKPQARIVPTPLPPPPKPSPPLVAKVEPPTLRVGPPLPMRPMPPMAGRNNFMASATGAGVGRAPIVAMAAPVRSMSMHSVQGDEVSQTAMPQSINGLSGASAGGVMAAVPRPTTVTLGNGAVAPSAAAAAPAPAAPVSTAADALAAPRATAAETVTVQNATDALSMDSSAATGTLSGEAYTSVMAKKRSVAPTAPATLPSHLPATWLVSAGPRTLAADAAGALFLSLDSGRRWQSVPAAWPGKVAQLKLAPAPAIFQLLTTTGAIWLSTDGLHWQPQ